MASRREFRASVDEFLKSHPFFVEGVGAAVTGGLLGVFGAFAGMTIAGIQGGFLLGILGGAFGAILGYFLAQLILFLFLMLLYFVYPETKWDVLIVVVAARGLLLFQGMPVRFANWEDVFVYVALCVILMGVLTTIRTTCRAARPLLGWLRSERKSSSRHGPIKPP